MIKIAVLVSGGGTNLQALIDALPAAEDISDANADEVSGQLDAIDEAKQALTEEQAARQLRQWG